MIGAYIVVAIIAYCLGSISFSVIFSRKFAGFDVREKGSKNAGSTNVLRTVGKKAAAITLICDILKGVVAVLIALITSKIFSEINANIIMQLAGFMAVLGHTFPIFFEFRGGKGVATALGAILMNNWQIGLICLVFAIVLMALTKMVSVGSITAAILYPILVIFLSDKFDIFAAVFSILLAVLVVFNHRSNIKRILEGKENKLSFKSKKGEN